MSDYVLISDNTCDLEDSFYEKNHIETLMLPYSIDDVVYTKETAVSFKDFYDSIRAGKMPTTMACNPEDYMNGFRKYLEQGTDIIYLAFSSGLSSSYSNSVIAAEELSDEFPDRKIIIVDSLCASGGEGLLLYKAVLKRDSGATIEELAEYIESIKLNICHYFTVNDLFHLHRGGRVSKATAIVGTLINVKPVLHVNDEGKLVSLFNVRGRKKSLQALVSAMEDSTKEPPVDNDICIITHGDCEDEANALAEELKTKFGVKEVIVSYASQTIGAHTGPGLIALFFMGNSRSINK